MSLRAGRRGVGRGLLAALALVCLLTLGYVGLNRPAGRALLLPWLHSVWNHLPGHLSPAPVQITLVGQARAVQVADGLALPRLMGGQKLALLLSPQTLESRQCDPFAGGTLELVLTDAASQTLYQLKQPLDKLPLVRVESDWRLDALPTSASDSSPFLLPETPTHPGRWLLELYWRCGGDRGRAYAPVSIQVDVPLHARAQTKPLWHELRALLSLEAREQLAGIDTLFKLHSDQLEPEARLHLLRLRVRALYMLGQFKESAGEAEAAVALSQSLGLLSETARLWDASQEAWREAGDLPKARASLEKSLNITRKFGPKTQEATNLYSLAILQWGMGEVFEALETVAAAAEALSRIGNQPLHLASRALELEWLQALGHHSLVNRMLDPLLTAQDLPMETLESLGWLLLRGVASGTPLDGNPEAAVARARSVFETAKAVWTEEGNQTNLANTLGNLCEVGLLSGDLKGAHAALDQVQEQEAGQLRLQFFLPYTRARLQLAEGHSQEALQSFQRLEDALRTGTIRELEPLDAAKVRAGIAEAYEQLGRQDEALTHYQAALNVLEGNTLTTSPLHRAPLLASYSRWEARVVRLLLRQGRTLDALLQVEAEAALRRADVFQASSPGAASPGRLEALQQELAMLRKRPSSPEVQAQILAREEALQRIWADSQRNERARSQTSEVQAAKSHPMDLAWLLQRVPAQGMLVRLAVLPDGLVVWTLRADASNLEVREQPISRADLEQLIHQFALGCREDREEVEAGKRLTALVFGSESPALPKNLLLVGEGVLRELPFSALPVGGKPLVSSSSLRWLPTLAWPEASGEPPDIMTLVGDPARDLPQAVREVEQIQALRPHARLLLREEATVPAVQAAFEQSGILHYAGHAVSDRDRPYLSYLKLARGGRLSLMDVRSMKLPRSLVFLNACGAGQVALAGGGALGLADGFLGAGAQAVVASRWDVPDEAGEAVAAQFYRALTQTSQAPAAGRVSGALQRTQLALMAGEGGASAQRLSVWSAFLALERF